VLIASFAVLQWLRWREPLGLDESLFALYGHWMTRGLRLYRDLWDSKPPGIFALFGAADRFVGMVHSAALLDALAAAASAILAYRLLLPAGGGAAWAGAVLAAFLPSAPAFGGPTAAAQAELLMAPLLLSAALVARRPGARAALCAGLLLGAATTLKLVAVALLPLPWLFASPSDRRSLVRAVMILCGFLAVPAACAALLAAQGTLHEAVPAVVLYPRAYAAETASRLSFGHALLLASTRFGSGLPFVLLLSAAGVVPRASFGLAWRALVWLGLALAVAGQQRQIAGYHLQLMLPPICILGGLGAASLWKWLQSMRRPGEASDPRGLAMLAGLTLVLGIAASLEGRHWVRRYAVHLEHAAGRIGTDEFLQRLGGPGPRWLEARSLAAQARLLVRPGDELLVWGLAPAVYVQLGCRPATRYAFHQTLLVEGSPLSRRWPDAGQRRAALLESLRRSPPRGVVIVRGDASGLEPTDSATELQQFPELARLLETEYRQQASTRSYTLLVRQHED